MERLREIALAHYAAGSDEVRALAHEFFDAIDFDGDGEVDYNEFSDFMTQEGYQRMRGRYVFRELDSDENGTLDFWEVITLYYIIKSGRPFCDVCQTFISQEFFTCVGCYESPQDTFNLCLDCYLSGRCDHNHNGRRQFLDSYTMLFNSRNSYLSARMDNQDDQPTPQMSNAIVPAALRTQSFSAGQSRGPAQAPPPRSSSSNAIDPAVRRHRMSLALRAFENALSIGDISTSLCDIL